MVQDSNDDPDALRVVGRTLPVGQQVIYLVQADDGTAYVAVAGDGPGLTIRSARDAEELDSQELASRVRTAIALHNHPDVIITPELGEDGRWHAQAVLAPGIAAFGYGSTREEATSDCEDGLNLLMEELRASA